MSGLFGKSATPAPAPVQPPAPMPDSMSPAVLEAQRRAQQELMKRAGRSATILSSAASRGDTGQAYTAKTLGAG